MPVVSGAVVPVAVVPVAVAVESVVVSIGGSVAGGLSDAAHILFYLDG